MKTAKEIALLGVFVAILIGAQFALSSIAGIEVVTVLFTSFCFYFGKKRGFILATAFSLLRCILFGFFVNIIDLYLVYYNLVALIFGSLGNLFNRAVNLKKLLIVTLVAMALTMLFILIDAGIMMLFYSFTINAVKTYILAGLGVLLAQIVCVIATETLLFIPLLKVYKTINLN